MLAVVHKLPISQVECAISRCFRDLANNSLTGSLPVVLEALKDTRTM